MLSAWYVKLHLCLPASDSDHLDNWRPSQHYPGRFRKRRKKTAEKKTEL